MIRKLAATFVVLSAGSVCADPLTTQRIDAEITAKLRSANVPPAGRADDATVLRRVYLDLLGRPPTAAEAEKFLRDPALNKVHVLIQRLRGYPEMTVHWRRIVAHWLRPGDGELLVNSDLLGYLAFAVGRNTSWNYLARDLLVPDAEGARSPGAVDYLAGFLSREEASSGAEAAAIAVASAFFGAQIQCARCHDHPYVPEWTKAHFAGMVAIFQNTTVTFQDSRPSLKEITAKFKGTAAPMFLDGKILDRAGSPRSQLAAHAFGIDAPHFKHATVNRVWKQLLGRGLVEPVDMIHAGNPASHPELFDFLADDFANHDFNLDRLISSIMHSEVYLRSARWPGPSAERPPPALFAVGALRPLSGPQMAWTAICSAGYSPALRADVRLTGKAPGVAGMPIKSRLAWEDTNEFRSLAQAFRTDPGGSASTAGQAIHLAFDPTVKSLIESKAGLASELAEVADDEKLATTAYLAILSRRPSHAEIDIVRAHLKAAKSRLTGCQDLVWALLAGTECRFNH